MREKYVQTDNGYIRTGTKYYGLGGQGFWIRNVTRDGHFLVVVDGRDGDTSEMTVGGYPRPSGAQLLFCSRQAVLVRRAPP